MVTDPDLGKIEKEARDQARLLSQLTRRVKEELVARNNGPTKNRPPGNDASSPASKPSDKSASPKSRPLEDLKPDGLVTARQGKKLDLPADPSSPSVGRQVALGGSTNGEYLPFVKEGSFTSLNTDQFLYYTFFNRVNEQIRSRWVTAIREFSGTLSHADVLRLSKLQRETQIEVLLQPDGYLKGVVIGKPSGEPGLDQAAVIAFRKTAPFLNPPIEMKGEDGLVHLYYSFVIQWQPTFMVKSAQ
jgi:protein TonB